MSAIDYFSALAVGQSVSQSLKPISRRAIHVGSSMMRMTGSVNRLVPTQSRATSAEYQATATFPATQTRGGAVTLFVNVASGRPTGKPSIVHLVGNGSATYGNGRRPIIVSYITTC